jgi:MoaA/NifB/PqqE/SkfB family radical SAM enzyme/GT2 family glycosyltransferase
MSIDISVVVPTYNRIRGLINCLDSLFTQDYPKDRYEIIVVDDSGNGEAKRVLDELKRTHPNLNYIIQHHKGPASARNIGVKASLGEIIGFVDDDCAVSKDWLRLMVESHTQNPAILAVGGLTLTPTQKTPVLVSQFLSTCSIETYLNGKQEVIFFPTCNVSLKMRIFDKYKFNETFPLPGGEDLEFFWRLFKEGHRFIWNKEIRVVHYRDDTTAGFFKQAYIYGRGNLLVQQLHKDQPLLKELKTGKISFWIVTLINIIKIPRFSYLLGRRLIRQGSIKDTHKKLSVYAFFTLHKILYIFGNIVEFIRIRKENVSDEQNIYHVPRLLILDITHSCNLHCRICEIWKTAETEKDIDISYIKKLLFQAKGLGINEIALSGGEPLLRKDIYDIFDYARSLKIKDLGVLTNGISVGINVGRLHTYLIDNTISLVVSLDSLRPNVHNEIRNSQFAWQETIETLKTLSALKKINPQVNFNLITIILNQNLEELVDLADFIKSLGAISLQFQALLPNNLKMAERKKSIFWVPEERLPILDVTIDELITLKKGNPLFIKNSIENLSLIKKYYRGTLTSNDIKCLSAYKTILVSNQGTHTTCFSSYGDIQTQDLKDVLNSRKITQAQKEVKNCSWPCLLPCFCDN